MVLLFVIYLFRGRVSLCSPGCSGTPYVDQVGCKLIKLCLPLPLSAGVKGVHHHAQH